MLSKSATTEMIQKIASIIEDMTLRAVILERVAGLPNGTWSRNVRKFMKEGPSTFPGADERWFDNRGTEMYGSLISGAQRVLKDQTRALEIQQDFYSQDMARQVAKSVADSINEGSSGFAKTKGILFNRGHQWALDIVKSSDYRAQTRKVEIGEREEDGPATYNPATEFGGDFSDLDRMKVLLGLIETNPKVKARVLFELKHRALPSELAAYQARKENPEASYSDLAKLLGYRNVFKNGVDTGYADGGGVRKLLEKITGYIVDISKRDDVINDYIDMALQQHGSGAVMHLAGLRIAEKQDGAVMRQLLKEFGLL